MERCDLDLGREARREVVMQKYPSEKAKPQPELLDTRVRPEEWAEALKLQLRRWGPEPPAREAWTLPNSRGTRHSPSRARHPPLRPGRRPRTSAPRPQDLTRALAAPAGSPRPPPLLPAQPSALPRSPRSAAPAPPAAALQTPPPQGAPGPRQEPSPGTRGAPGSGSPARTRRRRGAGSRRGGTAESGKRGPSVPRRAGPGESLSGP